MTKAMTSMVKNIETQIEDYLKNGYKVYFELYDSTDNKTGRIIGGRATATEIVALASRQKNRNDNYIFVYVFRITYGIKNGKHKRTSTILEERIMSTELIFQKPKVEKKHEKPIHKGRERIKRVKGKTPICDVALSVRAFNVLNDNGFKYIQDLKKISKENLLMYRNCGRKTVTELEEICESMGFEIGEKVK